VRSYIGLSKPPLIASWKPPQTPAKLKKKPGGGAAAGDLPSIRDILDGNATPTHVIQPLAPSSSVPGLRGTLVLVPNGQDYYFPLVYIGGEEGSLTVHLPPVQGILVVDLPKGMFTNQADINTAIDDGTGGGPPSIVGPS